MPNEDDPKHVAQEYRKTPTTEKILRQFLSLESCNANSKAFIRHYEAAIKGSVKLDAPAHCDKCEYVANTIAEIHWHEERNPGHEVL